MHIKPTAVVNLEHPVNLLRASRQPLLYLAMSRQGDVSVLDDRMSVQKYRCYQSALADASIDSAGNRLAILFAGSGALVIEGVYDDEVIRQETRQKLEACLFDPRGDFLWFAARSSRNELECQALNADNLQVITRAAVPDDFGDCSCVFCPIPEPASVALWTADGQGAQHLLWLHCERGGLKWKMEPKLDTFPPVFNDSGTELLASDGNSMRKYTYPALELMGQCESPLDDPFGTSLCFVTQNRALIGTQNNRLFAFDTETMNLAEEFAVSRDPSWAIEYHFSSKPAGTEAVCDILYFQRLGNSVVLVCQRAGGPLGEQTKDSLLFVDIEHFLKR